MYLGKDDWKFYYVFCLFVFYSKTVQKHSYQVAAWASRRGLVLHVSQTHLAPVALFTEHFTGWWEKALGVTVPAETVTCESGQRSQLRTVLLELWCFVIGVFGPEQEGQWEQVAWSSLERCIQWVVASLVEDTDNFQDLFSLSKQELLQKFHHPHFILIKERIKADFK